MENIVEIHKPIQSLESLAIQSLLSNVKKRDFEKNASPTLQSALEHQNSQHHVLPLAGGHHNHFKLTSDSTGIVKMTSQKEIDFYKKNMNASSPFHKIIPKCISFNEIEGSITLENLTANMHNPQVIDIKIGTHSYSGQKTPGLLGFKDALLRRAKWFYRDNKYGFRQRGWRVQGCSWIKDQDRGEIGVNSKIYVDDFVKRNNLSTEHMDVISNQLKEIGQVIKDANYGIINASVMIAVDGKQEPRVKFIDFAHAYEYKNEREKNHSPHNKGPVKGAFALAEIFSRREK